MRTWGTFYRRYTIIGSPVIREQVFQFLGNRIDEDYTVTDWAVRMVLRIPLCNSKLLPDACDLSDRDDSGDRSNYLRVYLPTFDTLKSLNLVVKGFRTPGQPGPGSPAKPETLAGRVLLVKVRDIWSSNCRDHFTSEVSLSANDISSIKQRFTFRSISQTLTDIAAFIAARKQQTIPRKTDDLLQLLPDPAVFIPRCAYCGRQEPGSSQLLARNPNAYRNIFPACETCKAVKYCSSGCARKHQRQHSIICSSSQQIADQTAGLKSYCLQVPQNQLALPPPGLAAAEAKLLARPRWQQWLLPALLVAACAVCFSGVSGSWVWWWWS